MNIYEFAMQMEKDGEQYYRQLAKGTAVWGLADIFTMLADEEVKHFNLFDKLARKEPNPQLAETDILDKVKNTFVAMAEKVKDGYHVDSTKESEVYRKACTIEEMSRSFYLEKAQLAEHAHLREVLLQLAAEEEKHLRIMENILEFVTRPEPGNWLENAEWHHLQEY